MQLLDDMEASLLRCKALVRSAGLQHGDDAGGSAEVDALAQRLVKLEEKVLQMKGAEVVKGGPDS